MQRLSMISESSFCPLSRITESKMFCTLGPTSKIRPLTDNLSLFHPHTPGTRPCDPIADWKSRQLQCQLDLSLVVPLVPDHVLYEQNRVIVMQIRAGACLDLALDSFPYRCCALVQHRCHPVAIPLRPPLFLGHSASELGRILRDQHHTNVMDVHEHLPHRRAALHSPSLQSTLWHKID